MRMAESLLTLPIMLLLTGAAFSFASASTGGVVRGTATCRERIPLRPGAVLEVSLQDVSEADAPSTELGSVRIEDLVVVTDEGCRKLSGAPHEPEISV